MKYNSLVIGADHYNTLWLIRCLGIKNYNPVCVIVGAKEGKSFVSKSRYVDTCYYIPDVSHILPFLLNLNMKGPTVIFASGDPIAEELDKNYDRLTPKYILHNCNNKQGEICYWMNKGNMISFANECGLKTPITYTINLTNFKLSQLNIPYPCLIKPLISAKNTKDCFRICYDESNLIKSLEELKEICSYVLLQEYVKAEYEYLIYGVSLNHKIIIPGGLHKLHTCKSNNNLGMMSIAYYSQEIPSQINDFSKIKEFISKMGYHGLFSIEFMITKDNAYFLEINLRNDGTCYITTEAGINMPSLWMKEINEDVISDKETMYIKDKTYGINEINYLKYTLKEVGIIQTIKDFKKASAFSIYLKKDIKPFIFKFLYH